jgi:hypothetical protein
MSESFNHPYGRRRTIEYGQAHFSGRDRCIARPAPRLHGGGFESSITRSTVAASASCIAAESGRTRRPSRPNWPRDNAPVRRRLEQRGRSLEHAMLIAEPIPQTELALVIGLHRVKHGRCLTLEYSCVGAGWRAATSVAFLPEGGAGRRCPPAPRENRSGVGSRGYRLRHKEPQDKAQPPGAAAYWLATRLPPTKRAKRES